MTWINASSMTVVSACTLMKTKTAVNAVFYVKVYMVIAILKITTKGYEKMSKPRWTVNNYTCLYNGRYLELDYGNHNGEINWCYRVNNGEWHSFDCGIKTAKALLIEDCDRRDRSPYLREKQHD